MFANLKISDLEQDFCSVHQVSAQGLYKRSLWHPSARSFEEISVQALYKSSLGKIYVRDLFARSQRTSIQFLCTGCL